MNPNADVVIMPLSVSPTAADALRRQWSEDDSREALRCRMTQASVNGTLTVLGDLGTQLYHCAVVSSLSIAPGWRLRIRLDGEDEAATYTVADAGRRLGHWHLQATKD